jgi:hypothetical protein
MKSKFLVLVVVLLAFVASAFADQSADFGTNTSFFVATESQAVTADNTSQSGVYTFDLVFSLDALATESVFLEKNGVVSTESFELAADSSKTFTMEYGDYVSVISSTTDVELSIKSVNAVFTANGEKEVIFSGERMKLSASGTAGFNFVISRYNADPAKELWVKENGDADVEDGTILADGGSATFRLSDQEYVTVYASETIVFDVSIQDRDYEPEVEVSLGTNESFFADHDERNVVLLPAARAYRNLTVRFELGALATGSVFIEKNASATISSDELAPGASLSYSLNGDDYLSFVTATAAIEVDVVCAQAVFSANGYSEFDLFGELIKITASGDNGFDVVISHEDATPTKEVWVLEGGDAAEGSGEMIVGEESVTVRLANTEYVTVYASEAVTIGVSIQDRTYDADIEIGLGESTSFDVSPDVRNVVSDAEEGEFDVVVRFDLDAAATASVFLAKNASATIGSDELAPGASLSYTLDHNDYVSAIAATTTMDVQVRSVQVNILDETDIDASYSGEALKILASNASGLRYYFVNEDATATKEIWLRSGAPASVGTGTAIAGDESLSFRIADAGYVSVCASETVSFSIKALDLDYNLDSFAAGVCVITATEEFTKLTNNSTDSVLIHLPARGHESGFEGNFYFKMNATAGLSLEELVGTKAYSSRILMPNEYIAFSAGSDNQQITLGLAEYGSTYSAALRSEMLGIANETAKTISFQNKQKKRVSLAVEGNGYVHFSIGGTASTTSALKVASGTPASLFVPFGLDVSVVASEPVKFKLIATPISGSGDPGGRIESNYLLK